MSNRLKQLKLTSATEKNIVLKENIAKVNTIATAPLYEICRCGCKWNVYAGVSTEITGLFASLCGYEAYYPVEETIAVCPAEPECVFPCEEEEHEVCSISSSSSEEEEHHRRRRAPAKKSSR